MTGRDLPVRETPGAGQTHAGRRSSSRTRGPKVPRRLPTSSGSPPTPSAAPRAEGLVLEVGTPGLRAGVRVRPELSSRGPLSSTLATTLGPRPRHAVTRALPPRVAPRPFPSPLPASLGGRVAPGAPTLTCSGGRSGVPAAGPAPQAAALAPAPAPARAPSARPRLSAVGPGRAGPGRGRARGGGGGGGAWRERPATGAATWSPAPTRRPPRPPGRLCSSPPPLGGGPEMVPLPLPRAGTQSPERCPRPGPIRDSPRRAVPGAPSRARQVGRRGHCFPKTSFFFLF
jgi:hypothetical protein